MEKKMDIRVEEKDDSMFVYGIDGLDGCECYSWGVNILLVIDDNDGRYLANKESGLIRKITVPGRLVGFSDDEFNYEAIGKLEHSGDAYSKSVSYGGIGRWNNCNHGLLALDWTLYPDGRYFADEDGFGMEDNDEVEINCILDEQFNVVVPWGPCTDVSSLLSSTMKKKEILDDDIAKQQFMQSGDTQSFEINPLDMGIAKIEMEIGNRIRQELPDAGGFEPIIEKYVSHDPTLNVSEVKVTCRSLEEDDVRQLQLSVLNKAHSYVYHVILCEGNSQDIKRFMEITFRNSPDGRCFFTECKGNALWLDNIEKMAKI